MMQIEENQSVHHQTHNPSVAANQSPHPVVLPRRKTLSNHNKENQLIKPIETPVNPYQNCIQMNEENTFFSTNASIKSSDICEKEDLCSASFESPTEESKPPFTREDSLLQPSDSDHLQSSKALKDTDETNTTSINVETDVVYATIAYKHKPQPKPRCKPPPKPKKLPPAPPPPAQTIPSNSADKHITNNTGKSHVPPAIPARPKIPANVKRSKSCASAEISKQTGKSISDIGSSDHDLVVSTHTSAKPSPSANKSVTRKESASKAIDMLKKKGIQLKEKSIKVFKPRLSQSDVEGNTNKQEHDNLTPSSTASKTSQDVQSSNTVSTNSHVDISVKNLPQRKIVEKRPPPPRPALPSVLKNRHSLEFQQADLMSSASVDLVQSNTSTSATTYNCLVEETNDQSFVSDNSQCVGLSHSNDAKISLISDENKDINKTIENSTIAAECNQVPQQDKDILAADGEVEQKTKPKPARPPPIQLSSSHLDILSTKKLSGQAKDSNEYEEAETSLFEMLQKKNTAENHKREVDNKLKDYISGEMHCVATQDYDAQNFTDISFHSGEKIFVLKQLDEQTLFGRNEEGEEGPFPAKYVCLDSS